MADPMQTVIEAFAALPPEAKRAMLEAQKKQWAESAPGDLRSPT